MEIRQATQDDFKLLYKICLRFFSESNFSKFTFDRDVAIQTVNAMCSGTVECRLVFDGDRLLGMAAWTYERFCTVEPIAHLFLFYTDESARGKGVGKALAEHIDACVKRAGAAAFYVASTGGFADNGINQKSFTEMFKKFGFDVMGNFLIKEYTENV